MFAFSAAAALGIRNFKVPVAARVLLLLHGCGVREGRREFNQRVEERRCVSCVACRRKKKHKREKEFFRSKTFGW